MVTSKGPSTFPIANDFQGQIQTPQSLFVPYRTKFMIPLSLL